MDFASSFPIMSFWVGKPYKCGVSAINRMDPMSLPGSTQNRFNTDKRFFPAEVIF